MWKGANQGSAERRGFQLASTCPLCQKDEETHSPSISLGPLGSPHFFSKNGLGLPPPSKRLDDGMDNLSNKKES